MAVTNELQSKVYSRGSSQNRHNGHNKATKLDHIIPDRTGTELSIPDFIQAFFEENCR